MKNSSSHILTTHVGSLTRPPELMESMLAKENGRPYDPDALAALVKDSVADVVKKQAEAGIDIPSDGEYGKTSFSAYVNERLTGFEPRERKPGESPILNWGRDRKAFQDFYEEYDGAARDSVAHPVVCTGPIAQVGQDAVQTDITNLKAALEGVKVEEAFLPAVAPGTVEGQRRNEYYSTVKDYLYGVADAMREEYKAIVDSGFLL